MESVSAASKALGVPELLSAVLWYLQYQYSDLVACVLVNSQWYREAKGLLWETCGDQSGPSIQELAILAPDRRQIYANDIKVLLFSEWTRFDQHGEWPGRFLPQLSQISFPSLETLMIAAPCVAEEFSNFQTRHLLQFAQPKLKNLELWDCKDDGLGYPMISEEFLEGLQQNCKRLASVEIPKHHLGVSLERFESFLLSIPSVQSVSQNWMPILSRRSFEVLRCLPRLRMVVLAVINDDWTTGLQNTAPGTAFVSLDTLHCAISAYGFKQMLPHLNRIRDLELIELSHSIATPLWATVALAKLKFLKKFSIRLRPDSSVHAEDLLSFIRNAPLLESLWISPRQDDPKQLSLELDDGIIDSIAMQLPRLKRFHLSCKSQFGVISENSLISLGKRCPLLECIGMKASIDWARLVRIAPKGIWANLKSIFIRMDTEQAEAYESYDEFGEPDEIDHEHTELAIAILQYMPLLGSEPWGGVEMGQDFALQRAMSRVLEERWDGTDPDDLDEEATMK